ncbi:MAG: Ig-like domain-containing protein, partial [Bacteroidota bacterium]|nr:Ig-like domain-containing protein [Bacteroidota bacterium]
TDQVTVTHTAPVANDDSKTTPEDTPVTGKVTATDVDGDALTFAKGSDPAHGTVVVNADGSYTYTPNKDYNGGDSFTVTVSDGNEGTATSTVTLSVTPVNDAPVANDDSKTTPEDTPVSGKVTATDVDGDALTFTKGSDPAHGTVVVNADGSYIYTPNKNYNGDDSFTVTVSDGNGGTATATVKVVVVPVNDDPVTKPLSVTTPEDTPLNGNVLTNVTDPDGDLISVTGIIVNGVNYPAGTTVTISGVGTMVVNSKGNYTFTPVANFNGNVPSVAYTVSDGHGGTATGIINITVVSVNDVPVAKDDVVSVVECTSVSGTVAANDTPSGDGGNVWSVKGNPSHGTVTMNADGTYIYIPTPNYHGTDTFTYSITDANGDQSIATVAITVTPLSEKVMVIKQSTQPQQISDGSFIWKYTIALTNLQNVRVNSIQVEDDLTKVFTHGESFKVMSIIASGNLRASSFYDGINHLNTLSDISYLAPMSKDSIIIELKVLSNGYVGNVYNQALFSGFSSRTGQIRDALSDDPSNKESSLNGPRATITDIPEVAILIPEGFSPNNDKYNDTFEIIHSDNTILRIEVFNRWGNRVYRNEEYQGDWDGKGVDNLLGKDLPEGTYYYIVTSTNKKTSEVKKITGYLTLRR